MWKCGGQAWIYGRKEKIKEKKKRMPMTRWRSNDYTCCTEKKRRLRQIGRLDEITFFTTIVIHRCCSKVAERLIHGIHASPTFCFFQKYYVNLGNPISLQKNHFKIISEPLKSNFWKIKSIDNRVIIL